VTEPEPEMVLCWRCFTPARVDLMVGGLGSTCARELGLIGRKVDALQDGPDLFDAANQDRRRNDGQDDDTRESPA
jgi:hypothetical protein